MIQRLWEAFVAWFKDINWGIVLGMVLVSGLLLSVLFKGSLTAINYIVILAIMAVVVIASIKIAKNNR